ncbi:MAG: hypothetical protein AVO39_02360 [delta proteobacterium MLS_D]|jgi:hypothetical protein|nr:MAG: hypothetical protein AVO39_02360 [delta proteobacterium MLS_D]
MCFEPVRVVCYSGSKADERPTAFIHRGRRVEIAEIMDRWYEGGIDPRSPVVNYFKVRTEHGEECLLQYLSLFDAWSIRM